MEVVTRVCSSSLIIVIGGDFFVLREGWVDFCETFCENNRKRRDENMEKKKYYMTTAIAYTSGKPHIGNTYEIVLADAIARYKRSQGYDVFFQTGTDEHGQKIELKAQEAGVTPKQYVDNVAGQVKDIWNMMNLSGRRMRTMSGKCRRFLRNCMSREIFIKVLMRGFTVRPASPSGRSPSLWTGNARTAGVR